MARTQAELLSQALASNATDGVQNVLAAFASEAHLEARVSPSDRDHIPEDLRVQPFLLVFGRKPSPREPSVLPLVIAFSCCTVAPAAFVVCVLCCKNKKTKGAAKRSCLECNVYLRVSQINEQ